MENLEEYYRNKKREAERNVDIPMAKHYKKKLKEIKAHSFWNELEVQDALIEKVKNKMEGLSKYQKALECKKFYDAMEKEGHKISDCVSFMSEVVGFDLALEAFKV